MVRIPSSRHRLDYPGLTTHSRSHCHNAPSRSPDNQPSSKPSKWNIATLQKTLKDKGSPFHRIDNKAKPFNALMPACSAHRSVNTSSLQGDTTHSGHVKGPVHPYPPALCAAMSSDKSEDGSHQQGTKNTRASATIPHQYLTQLPSSDGASNTGILGPSTSQVFQHQH